MTIPRTIHFIPFSDRSAVNLSGATRSMLTLCGELARRGAVAVVPFQEGFVAEFAREQGIEAFPVFKGDGDLPGSLVRGAGTMAGIRSAARKFGAELIHVHSAPGCKYAALAARTLGLPLVSHQRDIYERNKFHRGLGLANRIIAISRWVYSTLPPELASRATVVHNAVKLPEGVEVRGRGAGERARVGFAGRFNEDKGPDVLVGAAEILLPGRDDLEFHFWGVPGGGEGSAFARETRGRLEALSARFPGRVMIEPFRRDVEAFYRSMHIVAVPSRFAEPFGRVAIEGMAFGVAMIVAAHGGLTEIIEDGATGLHFRPGHAGDLAEKVGRLAGDEAGRVAIAGAGLAHVRATFPAEKHADAVLAVYREVLGR
jgi:glycosyltransferase involved in cell wall biosynthesis